MSARQTGVRVRTRVRFGVDGKGTWVATSQEADARTARDFRVSTDLRLMAAARSRLEPQGHAHFRKGELAEILSQVDKRTGEVCPMQTRGLRKAIARLVDVGLLMSDSWAQCLRVSMTEALNGNGYNTPCPRKPDASPLTVVTHRLVNPSGSARGGIVWSGSASGYAPEPATPDPDDGHLGVEDPYVDWWAVQVKADQEREEAGGSRYARGY